MPSLTAKKVLTELQKKKYHPIYFLQGDEPFYINEITDYMIAHILPEKEKALNLCVIQGKEHALSKIVAQVRTFSMLGERKVVIVKNAQELLALQKKKELEPLLHYLKKPHPKNILLFGYKHKKLSAQSPLLKVIEEKGVLLTTTKMYESQIPKWVAQYVEELGYKISLQASQTCQALLGSDLTLIANELKKVLLNLKKGDEITHNLLLQHVGMQKEVNHFTLQSALAQRNKAKTLHILPYFYAQSAHTLPLLLALLTTFFGKVLQAYGLGSQDQRTVASALKVHPYFVKEYLHAMRVYTLEEILAILDHLYEADCHLKGIQGRPYLSEKAILEELIPKILL